LGRDGLTLLMLINPASKSCLAAVRRRYWGHQPRHFPFGIFNHCWRQLFNRHRRRARRPSSHRHIWYINRGVEAKMGVLRGSSACGHSPLDGVVQQGECWHISHHS